MSDEALVRWTSAYARAGSRTVCARGGVPSFTRGTAPRRAGVTRGTIDES